MFKNLYDKSGWFLDMALQGFASACREMFAECRLTLADQYKKMGYGNGARKKRRHHHPVYRNTEYRNTTNHNTPKGAKQ